MKKIIIALGFVIILSFSLKAQDTSAINVITNHRSAREFAAGQINRADLDRIIQAAIRTPSAGNRQPWLFTVVQTPALARQIVPNITEGNIIIVISAPGDGRTNAAQILDCGLAAENIFLAAQAVGLSSRIYTGPIEGVNRNHKTALGLPRDHNAVALVRIGRALQGVDATSAASPRNSLESLVTYK